jgi:hypothetical protein
MRADRCNPPATTSVAVRFANAQMLRLGGYRAHTLTLVVDSRGDLAGLVSDRDPARTGRKLVVACWRRAR